MAFKDNDVYLIKNTEVLHQNILVTEKFHSKRSRMTFQLVLGSSYQVKSIDSEAPYTYQRRKELAKQEKFFTKLTKEKLSGIKPDDNEKREAMLLESREVTTDYFPGIRI